MQHTISQGTLVCVPRLCASRCGTSNIRHPDAGGASRPAIRLVPSTPSTTSVTVLVPFERLPRAALGSVIHEHYVPDGHLYGLRSVVVGCSFLCDMRIYVRVPLRVRTS